MFDPNSPVFAAFTAGRAKSIVLPATTTGCWIADALNGSLADGDLIGSLENKIEVRPAFVALGADRPTLKKNAVGRRSAIHFSGSQYLDAGYNYDLGNRSLTVFLVAKRAAIGGAMISKSIGGLLNGRWAVISDFGIIGALFETATGTKLVSSNAFNTVDTNFALYEVRINRASGEFSLCKNGTVLQTTYFSAESDTANISETLKLGRYAMNLDGYFMGDIACAIICQQTTGDITSGERAALYDSIEDYYGINL